MSNRAQPSREDGRAVRPSLAHNFELDQVRMAVRDIRHGEVRVIIQDGVIIQIDRLEKQRLR
jgi:hypothetical protein